MKIAIIQNGRLIDPEERHSTAIGDLAIASGRIVVAR